MKIKIKLCFFATVKTVHNRPAYFSERLHAAMKGMGNYID